MGRPERVVKFSLRSAEGLVFVSDIFASILEPTKNQAKAGAGTACRAPTGNRLQLASAEK